MTHQTTVPWAMRLGALAVFIALMSVFTAITVQADDPDWRLPATRLTVTAGDDPGELEITWDAHTQTTKTLLNYRVAWTPQGEGFKSADQTDWNTHTTGTQHTATGLDAGATYKVKVRTRYEGNQGSRWTQVVTGQAGTAPQAPPDGDKGQDEDPAPNVAPRSTHPTTPVAYAWSLRPSGLGDDDEFRLIFISSQKRNAGPTSISTYNSWIQSQAGSGHADIRTHRNGFRAVVCTEDDDARENTGMNHTTVVPVYWLGGAKVADSYNDFYDGSWDNDTNTKDRTEDGINGLDLTSSGNEPWTGCNDDGTESFSSSNVSQALGKDPATLGRPGCPEPATIP